MLSFPHLTAFAELRHAIFTRRGGISRAPYDSLNVGLGLGDRDADVNRNRQIVSTCLGATRIVFARQVHGQEVLVFKAGDNPRACRRVPGVRRGDAMITDQPGCYLAIQTADCQAILIYDPRRRVVANVHAGWRGSVVNIIGRTVAGMAADFGCRPVDMLAGIGPSLGPCCAEFKNYRREIPAEFWHYRHAGNFFDFWRLSRDQLTAAGVPSAGIQIGGLCTRCQSERFFSYRAEKRTGRQTAVIGLK